MAEDVLVNEDFLVAATSEPLRRNFQRLGRMFTYSIQKTSPGVFLLHGFISIHC